MGDSKRKKKIRSLIAKEVAANRPKAGPHGSSRRSNNKRRRKQAKRDIRDGCQ